MNFLLLFLDIDNPCNKVDILKIFYFIKELLRLAFIVVPIGSIVVLSFDLFKNVVSNSEGEQKKNLNIFIRRIIFMVVVFLIPNVVGFTVELVENSLGISNSEYLKCINVDYDTIKRQLNTEMALCTSSGNSWNSKTESCDKKSDVNENIKGEMAKLRRFNAAHLKYKYSITNKLNHSSSGSGQPSNKNYPAAEAALLMALPNRVAATGNDGTELYQYVFRSVLNLNNYRSCSEGTATAIRWSGTDDGFPPGPPSAQLNYVKNSSKWVNVNWNGDYSKLSPGDVFIDNNHTLMYVGKELLHKYFPDAPDNYTIVQASYNSDYANKAQSLCITSPAQDLTSSRWINNAFRCVKRESNSKYADIKYSKK